MKFLTAIDLNKNELQNARVQNLATAPATPGEGQVYYDSSGGDKTLYFYDGTSWVSTRSGAPSGAAGGDLSGTYPNPDIAAGVIVNADVNTAAAIAYSKLNLGTSIVNADINGSAAIAYAKLNLATSIVNGDVSASAAIAYSKLNLGTSIVNADVSASAAIVYSKLNLTTSIVNGDINASAAIALSKLATDPLARANHTGTQTASTVSDFDTQVRTSRLDQMAAPSASVSLNSQKITNLLDPTSAQDAASKAYVDSVAVGIDWKPSVRAATAVAGTLASSFENGDAIDGITLATGDRILIKDQSSGAENGIYVVAASGAPARASDANVSAEVTSGMSVFVEEGTANADSGWTLTTNGAITLGSTALVFTQFTGLGQVTAGAGLTKTGNTIDAVAAAGIDVQANTIGIDKTLVPIFKTALVGGAGPATSYVVTNPGFAANRRIMVEVIEDATGETVMPNITRASSGDVTVDFGASSVAGTDYRYLMTGLSA